MIHPLLLAYANAERAEHAAPTDTPTGVRSPAMTTHRAYAAWAEAGFPVEASTNSERADVCPGCRDEHTLIVYADGHTKCLLCTFDSRRLDEDAP